MPLACSDVAQTSFNGARLSITRSSTPSPRRAAGRSSTTCMARGVTAAFETHMPASSRHSKVSRGSILSKEELILKIWGADSEAVDNNAEAYISFLRKKLFYLGSKVQITSQRRLGYLLEEGLC